MMIFSLLSAFIPALDSDAFRARVEAFAAPRRAMAFLLAVLITAGPLAIPARAQGYPVYDYAGWSQRAMQYLKDNYQNLYVNQQTATNFLRQAAMSYQDYKQARALYQRITSGNITLSLVESLPVIEAGWDDGTGSNKLIIRPVFREQDRLNAPHVQVGIDTPDFRSMLKNLDFDVATVHTPTPDSQKTPSQIASDALTDGWLSWQLAQQKAAIDEVNWNIPVPNPQQDPYASLRKDFTNTYQSIDQAYQASAQQALQIYGSNSSEYLQAVDAAANFRQQLQAGDFDRDLGRLTDLLVRLDAKAQTQTSHYADARNALGMQIKRDSAKESNIQQVHDGYTQNTFQPFSLFDYIEAKMPDPPQGQAEGDAMKQTIQQDSIATTASEQAKSNWVNAMETAQKELESLASQKAQLIAQQRADMVSKYSNALSSVYAAQLRALDLQDQVIQQQATMPDGTRMIVPPAVAASFPGSVSADSPSVPQVMADNVATVAKSRSTLAGKLLANEVQSQSKGMAWNMTKPVLQGIDSAAKSLFGHSFNLTEWAANPGAQG